MCHSQNCTPLPYRLSPGALPPTRSTVDPAAATPLKVGVLSWSATTPPPSALPVTRCPPPTIPLHSPDSCSPLIGRCCRQRVTAIDIAVVGSKLSPLTRHRRLAQLRASTVNRHRCPRLAVPPSGVLSLLGVVTLNTGAPGTLCPPSMSTPCSPHRCSLPRLSPLH